MDDPQKGIQFGAEGLSIPLSKDSPKAAKCRLGTYYAKSKQLAEGGRSLFAVTESWKGTQLTDLKVQLATMQMCHSCIAGLCRSADNKTNACICIPALSVTVVMLGV